MKHTDVTLVGVGNGCSIGLFVNPLPIYANDLDSVDNGNDDGEEEPLDGVSQMRAFIQNDGGWIARR